jgi:parvulin-like peptidyl-prolyl isomerase
MLRKGQVSGILPSSSGFEIIRKDDDIEGTPKPFEDVEKEIQTLLQNQKLYKQLDSEKNKLSI